MTALNKLLLVLPVVFLSCICYAGDSGIQFPNEGKAAASPGGKFSVFSEENSTGKTNHVLILEDPTSKKKWSIYEFDRHVEVLWSPSGDKLIINDHGASNRSDCVIYDVKNHETVSIWNIVKSGANEKQVLSNHHAYISCSRWLTDDRVEVMLSAYGDANPDGIDKVGDYQVGSNQIKLKVVKKGEKK